MGARDERFDLMPRYRATVAGKPIGPWRGHREVALVDLVEAGHGSLDPETGYIISKALGGLEAEVADEPSTAEQDLLAEAVATLQRQGNRAPVFCKERAAGFEERLPEEAQRWREIGRLSDDLLYRAEQRRRAEPSTPAVAPEPRPFTTTGDTDGGDRSHRAQVSWQAAR